MAMNRQSEGAGHADHAAQAGMGVDEAAGMFRDQQVKLRRPWPHQNKVARFDRSAAIFEAIRGGKAQKVRDIAVAQCICPGDDRCPAHRCERRRDQPDTVQAGGRITAMQAKRRPDEPPGCLNQQIGWAGHDDGYRASKSLPGKKGSP